MYVTLVHERWLCSRSSKGRCKHMPRIIPSADLMKEWAMVTQKSFAIWARETNTGHSTQLYVLRASCLNICCSCSYHLIILEAIPPSLFSTSVSGPVLVCIISLRLAGLRRPRVGVPSVRKFSCGLFFSLKAFVLRAASWWLINNDQGAIRVGGTPRLPAHRISASSQRILVFYVNLMFMVNFASIVGGVYQLDFEMWLS